MSFHSQPASLSISWNNVSHSNEKWKQFSVQCMKYILQINSYTIRNDSVLNHIKRLTKRFDKDWNISNKTNNFKWMILSRNNFNFQSQIPLLDKITWQRILDNYHRVLNCLQNDLTNNYDQVLNFFSFYFHKSRRGSSKSDDDLDPGDLEGWRTLMTNVKDLIQVSLEDCRAEFSKSMAHPDDISCSDLNDDLKNLNQARIFKGSNTCRLLGGDKWNFEMLHSRRRPCPIFHFRHLSTSPKS